MKWAALKDVEPRAVSLLMVGCLLLTSLASWLYLFKKPLAEYREMRQSRSLSEARVSSSLGLGDTIGLLGREVEGLRDELANRLPVVDARTYSTGIIDLVGQSATGHQVTLQQITPGEGGDVMFHKLLFDATVSGRFQSILAWVQDIEAHDTGLVVHSFTASRPESGMVTVHLEMVVYQPPTEAR